MKTVANYRLKHILVGMPGIKEVLVFARFSRTSGLKESRHDLLVILLAWSQAVAQLTLRVKKL